MASPKKKIDKVIIPIILKFLQCGFLCDLWNIDLLSFSFFHSIFSVWSKNFCRNSSLNAQSDDVLWYFVTYWYDLLFIGYISEFSPEYVLNICVSCYLASNILCITFIVSTVFVLLWDICSRENYIIRIIINKYIYYWIYLIIYH